MRIDVNAQDILFGFRGEPTGCPVRHAIKRMTGYKRVKVTNSDAVWLGDHLVWLPFEESLRISTFDKTGEMQPHSFELNVSA